MKIAICDDMAKDCERLRKCVEQSKALRSFECETFRTGDGLLSAYEEGRRFDIVFLDVDMAISNCITNRFVKSNLIPEEKKEIYSYGFEIITSTIAYALIFIILAIVTNTFLTSVIFFCGFYFIRKFCGGFHANTYLKCHILSALNHIAVIAMLIFFPSSLQRIVSTISLYVCAILILGFAPVDHKNKRFIKNEFRHFRLMSCIYSGIIVIIATLNAFGIFGAIKADIFVFAYTLGTFSATISMLSAKILNSIERRKST